MRTPLITRRRATAGLMSATLLLAACGSGDSGDEAADAGDALPQLDASDAGTDAPSADAEEAPAPAGSAMVDLVGEEVLAESEFDGNLLPSVVVDDLNTGRKVNFRNLVPQDKPILLWMWAPH
ncbi:MAG: hypothetical protein ABJH68_09720 [Ilumatobacter sp.]|uniref:hypothetical protein n=1 Tax=Ilumatobacter sp. TaxID=1967498 RepID=UPI003297CABE